MLKFELQLKQEQNKITTALETIIQRLPLPVKELARYSLLSGGKRIRPILTICAAKLFDYSNKNLYELSTIVELCHVASLMHDDILDNADTRRGHESSYLKFGVSSCILAGDALVAEAGYRTALYNKPAMVKCLSHALVQTSSGEIEEIAQKGNVLNWETYIHIIEGKTAWLLSAACELGALIADASPEDVSSIAEYGKYLGLAFQIIDDALDFADEKITGKPTGGDLREQKCTPPIWFYYQSLNAQEQNIFQEKFKDMSFTAEEQEHIIQCIVNDGHAERTRLLAEEFLAKAQTFLQKLPQNKYNELLQEALVYVTNRKK